MEIAVWEAAGILLEGESGAFCYLEVALLAAKAPHDLPCLAVDLVDG